MNTRNSLLSKSIQSFSKLREVVNIPDLLGIQVSSMEDFLQDTMTIVGSTAQQRTMQGILSGMSNKGKNKRLIDILNTMGEKQIFSATTMEDIEGTELWEIAGDNKPYLKMLERLE